MDFQNIIIKNKYKLMNVIGEGGMSYVYQAHHLSDINQKYAVKILKNDAISPYIDDIIRFNLEATTISKIEHPNIVKVFEAGEYNQFHYIVMELLEGENLHNFLNSHKNLSYEACLTIFYNICTALEYIHSRGLIHRDLKLNNIIITNNEDYSLKLIDFGLSQIKELSTITQKEEIIGTFSYMSPEQCGLIKKPIDERSDLYSLGIIFYKLLSGKFPYTGETVSEIIHQHAAKIPEKLSKVPQVPEIIDKIVFKLLEKEPEMRYQSIKGLLPDVVRIKNNDYAFIPGYDDDQIKLSYRTPLVSRVEELNKIYDAFRQLNNNQGSFVLIGGEAGSGKTRLVQEFFEQIKKENIICIEGKCFSGVTKTPYSPLKDALHMYLSNLNRLPKDQFNSFKSKIQKKCEGFESIILKLNQAIEVIFDTVTEIEVLDSDSEMQRFITVISELFCNIAAIHGSLVILVDDLQWADNGTFEILNEIIYAIHSYPLLVIGTYRDNEIDSSHELSQILNASSDNITSLTVNKFTHDELENFLDKLLYSDETISLEIVELVYNKSQGNPFFSIEIIKQLISDKALYLSKNEWKVDKTIIATVDISETIIDIVIKRISLLNENESLVISFAAVIGKTFSIELLFGIIEEVSNSEIVTIIDKAISLQLLEETAIQRGRIVFVHDRIREAFYKKIGKDIRKNLHLKIGLFIEKISESKKRDFIFDLIYHFIESDQRDKIVKYAIPAGILSMDTFANNDAIRYFSFARDILEERNEIGSENWIYCSKKLLKLFIIVGKYSESVELGMQLLQYVDGNIEKAEINMHIGEVYVKQGNWQKNEKYASISLSLLGETLYKNEILLTILTIKEFTVQLLHRIFPFIFIRKVKLAKRRKYEKILENYLTLGRNYWYANIKKYTYTIIRSINIGESKLGNSGTLAEFLSLYALMFANLGFFKLALYYSDRAIEMSQASQAQYAEAIARMLKGYQLSYMGRYDDAYECLKASNKIMSQIGEVREYANTICGMALYHYYNSDYDNFMYFNNKVIEVGDRYKNINAQHIAYAQLGLVYIEIGKFEECSKVANKLLTLSKTSDYFFSIGLSYLAFIKILNGQFKKGLNLVEEAIEILERNSFKQHYINNIYILYSNFYIEYYKSIAKNLSYKEKKDYLKHIKSACAKMKKSSIRWPAFHGDINKIYGKYYALIGKSKKAEKKFLLGINQLEKSKRKFYHALILLEYGVFLEAQNRNEESRTVNESAYYIFSNIDAQFFAEMLRKKLNITSREGITSSERLQQKQRLNSLIKVGHVISSILDIKSLIVDILNKAIEVTGAQSGYLFLLNEQTGLLELRISKNILDDDHTSYSHRIVDLVYKSGNAVITTNAEKDDSFRQYESVRNYGLKSIISVPLKLHDKVIGVFYLDNQLSEGVFTEEDRDILTAFAAQSAIALDNAYLYKNLELKVEEKTNELSESNKVLKQTLADSSNLVSHIGKKFYNELQPFSQIISLGNSFLEHAQEENEIYDNDTIEMAQYTIEKCNMSLDKIEHMKDMLLKNFGKSYIKTYEKIKLFFNDIQNEYRTQFLEENIAAEFIYDDLTSDEILMSKEQMYIAIENILNNAIQALTHKASNRKLQLAIKENNSKVVVTIWDNGPGIPDAIKDNIFTMFYTSKDKQVKKGLGLGMFITKWIIEDCHKGVITVDTLKDQHTLFNIELPFH